MRTMGLSRTVAALVAAAGTAAILTGCAGLQADASGAPTSSPLATRVETAPPTPTPSPTATASPTPEPTATCETVFINAEYTALEADGLTFRGDAKGASEVTHAFGDTGGISCLWLAPQSDVMAWYAHWPSDRSKWESLREELLGKGYTEISDPFAGIIQSPPDPNYTPALTYRDGVVYHVSTPRLFLSVAALQ